MTNYIIIFLCVPIYLSTKVNVRKLFLDRVLKGIFSCPGVQGSRGPEVVFIFRLNILQLKERRLVL